MTMRDDLVAERARAPDEIVWLRIPLTLPRELLPNRANRASGWSTSRARKKLRQDAGVLLQSAMVLMPSVVTMIGPIHCRITVMWEVEQTRGKTGMRRKRQIPDPDNLLAGCKGLLDALEDVGLIANDRSLLHEPVVQGHDPVGEGYTVVELWQDADVI